MNSRDMLNVAGAFVGTRELLIFTLVIGILIGWIVLGWWLWPVQWTDAAPSDLQPDYRQFYLEAVARLNATDPGLDAREWLGADTWSQEQLQQALNEAYNSAPDLATQNMIAELAEELGMTVSGEVAEAAAEGGRGLGGILAVFLIVLLGIAGVFLLLRLRQPEVETPSTVGGDPNKVAASRTQWSEEEAPLAQFVTSYALGDDYYDQSFSIETPSGEFLGECGVGISEAIGVGDPKKVTAFEVWLFDKNDIRTVTKVLMSEHCFNDDELKAKLAPKGEAVLAEEGKLVTLETASLRVQAKVIELEYGEADLPLQSFISRLTMELAAWQLEGAEEGVETLPPAT